MNNSQTQKYAFILGRERDLCLAELETTLSYFGFGFYDLIVSDNVVFINFNEPQMTDNTDNDEIARLITVLGGTVKIFRVISSGRSPAERSHDNQYKNLIEEYIQNHLKKEGKFNFALSSYTNKFDQRRLNSLGLEMKKDFKRRLSSRFVELREGKEVSTILTYKSKLVAEGFEFGLFNESVGILVAATNPEEWGERDYDKPAGDKYSGMLPPKLARMMVNLALGTPPLCEGRLGGVRNDKDICTTPTPLLGKEGRDCLVVDPFCGSGNILLEALMLGCDVFGSDSSEKAVKDSQDNLSWLKSEFLNPKSETNPNFKIPNSQIVQADATSADLIKNLKFKTCPSGRRVENYNHVVIVAEPYLGEPKKYKPSMNAARGEYMKIKELYLDFLMNFKNFLTLQTSKMPLAFCLVFPLVETAEGKRFSLFEDSVDEIRKIGYTTIRPPLTYGRDYQVVKRQIVLLQLNSY